ncbi:MAG: YncE family protein, partial [Acidobacteriota bacterium]
MKVHAFLAAGAAAFLLAAGAHAQIAVSANDGKQIRPGDDPPGMRPDTIATIDLSQTPPKVLAKINAPASMIGPPKAVFVAPDSSFAIVTCGQRPDPGNPGKPALADTVTVLDIAHPKNPRVIQTAAAGMGASGVSINPAVNLALVANTSGSVSVFTIAHKKLTKVGDVQMEQGSGPTDVVFSRDGARAYVVERGGNRISILKVDGSNVTSTGESFVTGRMPYGMVIAPDNFAVNTNLGGAMVPEP